MLVTSRRDKAFDQGEKVLIPVPGKPGVSIKMTKAEAKARGLLPGTPRTADSPETKERKPSRNKGRKPDAEKE